MHHSHGLYGNESSDSNGHPNSGCYLTYSRLRVIISQPFHCASFKSTFSLAQQSIVNCGSLIAKFDDLIYSTKTNFHK